MKIPKTFLKGVSLNKLRSEKEISQCGFCMECSTDRIQHLQDTSYLPPQQCYLTFNHRTSVVQQEVVSYAHVSGPPGWFCLSGLSLVISCRSATDYWSWVSFSTQGLGQSVWKESACCRCLIPQQAGPRHSRILRESRSMQGFLEPRSATCTMSLLPHCWPSQVTRGTQIQEK